MDVKLTEKMYVTDIIIARKAAYKTMIKKYIIYIIYLTFVLVLMLFVTPNLFANENNCGMSLNLTNLESFDMFYIQQDGDVIYEDSIGINDTILNYKLYEPKISFGFINNDPEKAIFFYMHPGMYSLHVDLKTKSFYFIDSPLNNEKIKVDKMEDSLRTMLNIPSPFGYQKLLLSGINVDSLVAKYKLFDSLRENMQFSYFKQNSNSFLALDFIHTSLQILKKHYNKNMQDSLYLKRESDLKYIFKNLPSSFKEYPTYKACLELFKKKGKKKEKERYPKALYNQKIN